MESDAAIERIQESCKAISLELMRITPAARHLGDEALQAEILKTSHELTVGVETIKKKLLKARDRDASPEL